MRDDCLLELYHQHLTENARCALDVVIKLGEVTMETIMLTGRLTTQQARRGVWGLDSTGLILYKPIRLAPNGKRLAELLAKKKEAA